MSTKQENRRRGAQLTALRFAADALTSRPSEFGHVIRVLRYEWDSDAYLTNAAELLLYECSRGDLSDSQALLWIAADELLCSDRPEGRDFGAALYASLLSRGLTSSSTAAHARALTPSSDRLQEMYRRGARGAIQQMAYNGGRS